MGLFLLPCFPTPVLSAALPFLSFLSPPLFSLPSFQNLHSSLTILQSSQTEEKWKQSFNIVHGTNDFLPPPFAVHISELGPVKHGDSLVEHRVPSWGQRHPQGDIQAPRGTLNCTSRLTYGKASLMVSLDVCGGVRWEAWCYGNSGVMNELFKFRMGTYIKWRLTEVQC